MSQPSSATRRSTAGTTRSKSSPIDSPRRNRVSFGITPRNAWTNSRWSASAGISESRPPWISRSSGQDSGSAAGRDDGRGLERAREAAAEHAVELDPGERPGDRLRLRDALRVERDLARVDGRAVLREVRHLGVAHEVEAAAHRRRIARCWRATSSRPRRRPPPRRNHRSSCSTGCAGFSTSTGSARGMCGRGASGRVVARTSRFSSNVTRARSCSADRRDRRCRRLRTTSSAKRGCSSQCARPASRGCRRSSRSARTRACSASPST